MSTTIPLRELVEEVAARLTSEQIHALAARVAAAEVRPVEPAPPFTLAAAAALDLDAVVRHLVDLWGPGGIGVDLDLVAVWLLPQLVTAGVDEIDALGALQRITGWHQRTAEDRERAVARAMVADGWSAEQVAAALKETEMVPC